MPRYEARIHKNQDNEKLKWCICVCGIPDLAFGIFDTPGEADAKAKEMSVSFDACVDWIKDEGAERREVDTNHSEQTGPFVKMDKFHIIQKLGRKYAVHRGDELDKVPMLNDSNISVIYRNGRGTQLVTIIDQQKGKGPAD